MTVKWTIQASIEGVGGPMALRNSDNLRLPSREKIREARRVVEGAGEGEFRPAGGEE